MGKQEKKGYLLAICKRYHHASRREKGKILDEFCTVCGYNRKYAIRRLKLTVPLQQSCLDTHKLVMHNTQLGTKIQQLKLTQISY